MRIILMYEVSGRGPGMMQSYLEGWYGKIVEKNLTNTSHKAEEQNSKILPSPYCSFYTALFMKSLQKIVSLF